MRHVMEERTEGEVAKGIERQTSKIPSDWFMWAAFASMGLSLALQLREKRDNGNFVGQWVPTLLLFGLYNKIVKVMGSDKHESGI